MSPEPQTINPYRTLKGTLLTKSPDPLSGARNVLEQLNPEPEGPRTHYQRLQNPLIKEYRLDYKRRLQSDPTLIEGLFLNYRVLESLRTPNPKPPEVYNSLA